MQRTLSRSRFLSLLSAASLAAALCLTTGAVAAGSAVANVRINNNSSTTVVKIQASSSRAESYSRADLLGNSVIRPGTNLTVNFDHPAAFDDCEQDIKATGADGRVWEWRMNVCRVSQWSLGE